MTIADNIMRAPGVSRLVDFVRHEHTIRLDEPVQRSLLDDVAAPIVGRGPNRIEGPLKVSGHARYAAEHHFPGLVHGVIVQAPIGSGRMTGLETSRALSMPGVLAIVDDAKLARFPGAFGGNEAPSQEAREIAYFRQVVAVAVADTFERARAAAAAVEVRCEASPGAFDFECEQLRAAPPTNDLEGMFAIHTEQGDVEAALARSAAVVDEIWTTPSHNHAAMEPHASVAIWDGDDLTVHGSFQSPVTTHGQLASSLGIKAANVRVVSRFVGGGFGSKLGVSVECVAAAIAARQLGRPVKIVMARQHVFDIAGRRPETRQHVRLGADADGRLTAVSHATITSQQENEVFFEPAGIATHFLYAGDNRMVDHKVARLNKVVSISMRAPGEAVGQLAMESAMDELADKLGMDPVELRIRNDPGKDPEKGLPFSSKSLVDCLRTGAERFGWERRNRTPGAARDGEWLVGQGVATAVRGNIFFPSKARVGIGGDGRVSIATEMTDIGTGTYTVLAQIASDLLGVPLDHVDVALGDTDDPKSAGSGGSWGASTSGSAVYAACEALREKLAGAAGCTAEEMTLADGHLQAKGSRRPIREFVGNGIEIVGAVEPGKMTKSTTQASYGAHFCEVRVSAVTGEVRIARWSSVFAAGRILNAKTATSQCLGGIIFGVGGALFEDLVHDPRTGKIVNRDLGEYHVPAHADIPDLDVLLLDERDHAAGPLLAKGVGELGISGAGAAVANAIYNATGIRVRDYPITLDKLLPHLPG